jgi:hypothetical protein
MSTRYWDLGDRRTLRAANAVKKLTDQTLIARVALEAKIGYAGETAAKKLTDQTLIARVALEAPSRTARLVAVQRLTDDGVLRQVAGLEPSQDDITAINVARDKLGLPEVPDTWREAALKAERELRLRVGLGADGHQHMWGPWVAKVDTADGSVMFGDKWRGTKVGEIRHCTLCSQSEHHNWEPSRHIKDWPVAAPAANT